MALTHGVNASKLKTSVSTPIKVASGVHFAVGAAPVQMVGGKTNEVIMANDYEEAVRFLGYSDDWEKYPLCMEIYTAFTLYNVAPVIMVNVLDPAKHKKKVTAASMEPVETRSFCRWKPWRTRWKWKGWSGIPIIPCFTRMIIARSSS